MKASEIDRLIGHPENEELEFKDAEILRQPWKVVREIVGFLNANGGTVWIGIQEQDGIATSFFGIPNVVAARDALLNSLVETVEPSPGPNDVRFEIVAVAQGNDLLKISVNRGSRRPYALLKDRGRQFPIRIGSRVRDMEREEIRAAFRDSTTEGEKAEKTKAKVQLSIDRHLGKRDFWWTLVPTEPLKIDFEHMNDEDKKFVRNLLTNPEASGNRRMGWTMVIDQGVPSIKTTGVAHVVGDGAVKHEITISQDGSMTFVAPRSRLDRNWDDEGVDIFPFALIELPVSTFRMAARFLPRFRQPPFPTVVVGATIGGMKGATLRPGSPAEPRLPWKKVQSFDEANLVVDPIEVDGDQLVQKPDAAAYRLVRRIYERFGFDVADIPPEFDAVSHILRFGRT